MSAAALPLRVLIVAPSAPWPLNGGGRIRRFHYLAQLARHARCTVVLPAAAAENTPWPRGVDVVVANDDARAGAPPVVTGRTSCWALRAARRHFGTNPALAAWLGAHAVPARFDVALLCGAVLGQYVDCVRIPAVWDPVDELALTTLRRIRASRPLRAARMVADAWRYAAFERDVAARSFATIFASPVDARAAQRWAGAERVHVLTNGVDAGRLDATGVAPEAGTLAFVGALDYPPNIEGITRFVQRIWPDVRNAERGAARRLLIVGRNPVGAVRALGTHEGVEVHADVPDVRPFLARAAVVVVPTRLGAGVKNKVLEACAAGRPVVATPRAVAGLSGRGGIEFRVARRPADWVREISNLIANPVRAARLGLRAQRWVRAAHDWETLGLALFELLRDASGAAGAGGAPASGPARSPRRTPIAARREAACH